MKILLQEAVLQMQQGVLGVGESHDNGYAKMLVLKLLQAAPPPRHLLIEVASSMQGSAYLVSDENHGLNAAGANAFDRSLWKDDGVCRLSTVVYQAQKRGIEVICADHPIAALQNNSATSKTGMLKRNRWVIDKLLALNPDSGQIRGVILLMGKDHFEDLDTGSTNICQLLQAKLGHGLNFGWVDARSPAGSGYGVRI